MVADAPRQARPRSRTTNAPRHKRAPITTTSFDLKREASVATRTLIAAGYRITDIISHRRHLDVYCERPDILGTPVPYLIVICDTARPPSDDIDNIRRDAESQKRVLVVVATSCGDDWIAWLDFLAALGGGVPSWRALGDDYSDVLRTLGKNKLPPGEEGEAWRLFEEACADGLGFVLGRRVLLMGGAKRATKVSDMLTQTPDGRLLVIDAKASGGPYNVTWPRLRALVEYVERQRDRQRGLVDVSGALIIASEFEQSTEQLKDIAGKFVARTGVPLALLPVDTLLAMVRGLASQPHVRGAMRWADIFCQPGLVTGKAFAREFTAASSERFGPDGPRAAVRVKSRAARRPRNS